MGFAGRGTGSASRGGATVLSSGSRLRSPLRGHRRVRPSAAATSRARKVSTPPRVTAPSGRAGPAATRGPAGPSRTSPRHLDRAPARWFPSRSSTTARDKSAANPHPGRGNARKLFATCGCGPLQLRAPRTSSSSPRGSCNFPTSVGLETPSPFQIETSSPMGYADTTGPMAKA